MLLRITLPGKESQPHAGVFFPWKRHKSQLVQLSLPIVDTSRRGFFHRDARRLCIIVTEALKKINVP